MKAFIDEHPHFGVEPVCRALGARPGSYYDVSNRPPSSRSVRDEELKAKITAVFEANHQVYGFRKMIRALHRDGVDVAWCTVRRLMRELGIEGARRGTKPRRAKDDAVVPRSQDLVDRDFSATRPKAVSPEVV